MQTQDTTNGAPPRDPVVGRLLTQLEVALARDAVGPAELVAGVEAAMAAIDAARAPAVRSRRLGLAEARVRKLSRAVIDDKSPKAYGALRDAVKDWRKALGLPEPKPPRRRWGLGDALADRAPPKSVCRKLEWEVGRPPMLIGPPGAGKTYAIQAAYLCLILGVPLWGCDDFYVPRPCDVLHVDLDQGANKTLRRHRRLLRGWGVDLGKDPAGDDSREAQKARAIAETVARAQLAHIVNRSPDELGRFAVDEGEGLRLGSLQPEEIARWRAEWAEAVKGFDVCFVDSLRRLAPFLDENDSRFSIVPDTLREVSEATQCVIVLLHHASNKQRQPQGRGPKMPVASRGTSAIDGAAGSQLTIEEDGDARKVSMSRAGDSAKIPPFWLTFIDGAEDRGVKSIRVAYQTREEASAPKAAEKSKRSAEVQERVLVYVRKKNVGTAKVNGYGPGRKQVVADVEGRNADLYAAIEALLKEGRLVEVKDKESKAKGLWTKGES